MIDLRSRDRTLVLTKKRVKTGGTRSAADDAGRVLDLECWTKLALQGREKRSWSRRPT